LINAGDREVERVQPPDYNLAMFVSRDHCISCGSSELAQVGGGLFSDQPLRSYIEGDPWGENPMPLLADKPWSLVQCVGCTQRFHRYILSPQWNEIRFSQWMSEEAIREFEAQHETNSNSAGAHVQHILRLRDLGVERVLDFGCGFGKFLEMCRLFDLEAVGVDRSNARRSGAGVEIFAELDEVPGAFDAITMFEVLEHLDDPLAILKVLSSRLHQDGVMIVEVPDTSGVTGIDSRDSYHKVHPLDHINAFTPETLVGIMARAGFAPLRKTPAFVTTSPVRLAKDVAKYALNRPSTQRYFRKQ
jgi:SAM-dependent methyltransferase